MVSVIVPVYNAEKYLNECIESIVNQAFKDLELILVDDGSTDKSGEMCDEWARRDNRIKVIHKKNSGVSAARNAGLDIVQGNYVAFVDSDDYIDLGTFGTCVNAMLANKLDMVVFGHQDVGRDGYLSASEAFEMYTESDFKKHINTFLNFGGLSCVWNKLFITDIIKENTLRFREGIAIGEDSVFNCEYFKYCKRIKVIPNTFYKYRRHGCGSFSIARADYWHQGKLMIEKTKQAVLAHNIYDTAKPTIDAWELALIKAHFMFILAPNGNLTLMEWKKALDKIYIMPENKILNESLKKEKGLKNKAYYIAYKLRIAYFLVPLIKLKARLTKA